MVIENLYIQTSSLTLFEVIQRGGGQVYKSEADIIVFGIAVNEAEYTQSANDLTNLQ